MIINQTSTLNTLKEYLFSYRRIFYKRSFEIFTLIILSFIAMQNVNSIKFIYKKFISKHWNKSLNSFYYFLSQDKLPIEDMMMLTLRNALALIPKDQRCNYTVYLSIDDTLQSKFGDKLEGKYPFFDHAKHNGITYILGHCLVTLTVSIPISFKVTTRYITLPIGSKIYDKTDTKLTLAHNLISDAMVELSEFQVIVLCDSWYTKKDLLKLTTEFVKEDEFYVTKVICLTNLLDNPVEIVVTTKDITTFSSVRLYLSTTKVDTIKINNNVEKNIESINIYYTYKLRWNIEVVFYQEKLFWSFGKYMVRKKVAIEKYINLVGVAYSTVIFLPFICDMYSELKFQSPQEIKYIVSDDIKKELFFSNLLEFQQIKRNLTNLSFLKIYQDIKKLTS